MADISSGVSAGYRYSYSGTDARASVYFEGRGDLAVHLEALHTISWSVNEAKGQARAFGYRGIKGLARGIRTIAGSLIMMVIEDNPLAPLMDVLATVATDPVIHWPGWSIDREDVGVGSGLDNTDFTRRLAPTIPPFNILVQYVAEGSKWVPSARTPTEAQVPGAAFLLKGVEIINEGLVTSISDSVSEMNYSFICMDVKTLSNQQFKALISPYNNYVPSKTSRLQQEIIDGQRLREQVYKTQTNEFFGPANNTSPFSGIV